MNDQRCVIHTLTNPAARKPAAFVFFGMTLCEKHLAAAAAVLEDGSVRDVIRAARRGEI